MKFPFRIAAQWDLANRFFRDPDVKHTAVIVAEDVASRFFNVLALIARLGVPIIALQVSALRVGPYITLRFTKVLDLVESGPEQPEAPVSETPEVLMIAAPYSFPLAGRFSVTRHLR